MEFSVNRVAMFLVINHRVGREAEFSAKLNAVEVLLKRGVEIAEDVDRNPPSIFCESGFVERSQLRLDNVFVLPSVESQVNAVKSYLPKQREVAIVDKPNV